MSLTADPLTAVTDVADESLEAKPVPKRRGTLLIVDDEDGPRQSLRVIFKDDYDLLMAEDGPTAIKLAQENNIDVAVLDIRMAGMSGIEVLERIKYVNPDIEAIMMTAFETTDTIRQALRLRACDYINKPFDLATMRAAVGQAMQRRTLESEIHSSAEKVQELLAELQNQRIEEQIAKTRGDIYASIIHDINGPLTVISGFVQVLNQRLNRASRMEVEDLEFIKDRLRIVARQVSNCIEISRRYLGFLRRQQSTESGSVHVSVSQLLRDLEHLVHVHPSLLDNEFALTPFGDDVAVKINGTDVIQILLNLTVNAFQCAALNHRVEIGGEVLRAALDLTKFKDGPHDRLLNIEGLNNTVPLVKLWVRDDGPGIPQEVLPKIFQPYFTTKGPRQGTGLGLNIVQRLIKEGNGALHCHTRPGEGTTFTVYLPAENLVK
ncbi:MAG TPA: hybrid sensor histidine kinase/response regulator [Verrucomicrobiae bacterium]|nr:hybrid sensor histidine kinase/response regulator [Verrucomicrobiae bacterium]